MRRLLIQKAPPLVLAVAILLCGAALVYQVVHPRGSRRGAAAAGAGDFIVGRFDHKLLAETSGLVASRKYPGVYWTHNDSGNAAEIFAVSREGRLLGRYPVDAENRDWEDISTDDAGHLYIADIGNNGGNFKHAFIYMVDEPDPNALRVAPDAKGPTLPVVDKWKLKYPIDPVDAEAFFVYGGKGYLISKDLDLRKATLMAFDLEDEKPDPAAKPGKKPKKKKKDEADLVRVANLPIRAPVTGASISRDGKRLAVISAAGPYVFHIDGDVAKAAALEPGHVTLLNGKMEAVCFTEGGLLATTEDRDIFFFRDEQLAPPKPAATTQPAPKPAER